MASGGTAKQHNFTPETVVNEAAAIDAGVIARLAACHPSLERLKAPGLGRVLAGLITLADVARIAGVDLEELLAYANGERDLMPAPVAPKPESAPDWLSKEPNERLDVRPLIQQGGDPFHEIMSITSRMAEGQVLEIEAPFDPVPLRRVLGERGFAHHGQHAGPDHWRIRFMRERPDSPGETPPASCGSNLPGRSWLEADGLHVDVRGLNPPAPMLAVIGLIEGGAVGGRMIVHHEREPLYLYPELAERGWTWRRLPGEDNEVRLELVKGES
jgi:uncharacterized protein (DUF2249 family)